MSRNLDPPPGIRAAASRNSSRSRRARTDPLPIDAGINPLEVQDRVQLAEYLSQSISSEYKIRKPDGAIAQTATYIKSYIVERHEDRDSRDGGHWAGAFAQALPRRDQSLLLLFDPSNVAYFADLSEPRFILIHTIGKTDTTDETIARLTQGSIDGFDRAWLPTDFLYGSRRGPLRGFKFGHLAAVSGISGNIDELEFFSSDDDSTLDVAEAETEIHDNEIASTTGGYSEQSAASSNEELTGTVSRLSVSNTHTAETDFRLIKSADIFAGRQALDTIQFVSRDKAGGRIVSSLYTTGKMIGGGTSLGLYLLTVDSIRSAYARTIKSIEDDFSLGWQMIGEKFVHRGEPLLFVFPNDVIVDLHRFVESVFRAAKPFRLFGIPHSITDRRIDVEAIDLHANDQLSFEITPEWMRVYLPKGSCGNIIARLYANLQHTVSSNINLASGGGVVLFSEADARHE